MSTTRIQKALRTAKNNPAILFFLVYLIASLFFVPKFANPRNLGNILVQSTDLIIMACGMTFVFMNGGIDFSMTATIALGSVVGASIMILPGNPVLMTILAIAVMVVIGVIIGIINGLSVTILKMPSFIATMATQLIFSGAALFYTQSATIGGLPDQFLKIGEGRVLTIPVPIIICVLVVGACYYLLHQTVFGRYVFAIGTNHATSGISGIPVKKTIFKLFIISGILASISSIIMTSKSGAGMPGMAKDKLMDIVAAVVIGGTSVTGGSGNMLGTVIGAILVIVLNNSLNLLGVEWYFINVLKGMMVLAVALLDVLRKKSH